MATRSRKSSQRSQRSAAARMAAEKAKADARNAEATARAEEARARGRVADAEAKRIESEAAARAAQTARAPYERMYQLGINAGAPVAGMAIGHVVAKSLARKALVAQTAKNKAITDLAATLSRAGRGKAALVKAAAAVATADKLGLLRRGPLGVPLAGVMLADGAFARFVLANNVENETAREAIRAVGTTSLFAATTLVGNRLVQNANVAKLPSAKAVAAIEAARMSSGAAASAPGVSAKVLGIAGKVALPLMAAATAVAAYQGYKRAGLRGAAIGAADSLTFGSVSAIARATGNGRVLMSTEQQRSAGIAAGRRALVRHASRNVGGGSVLSSVARRAALARKAGDGTTRGYSTTRTIHGKSVRVTVNSYKTPKR